MRDNEILKQVENALSVHFNKKVIIQSTSNLGGGCINHASKISTNVGNFFLKWNAHCAPDIFLREAESLRELKKAAQGQLLIPEVFVAESAGNIPGFLLTEYLEPGYSGSNIDEKLGRGLAMIHQYQNDNFGFYHDNYCGATIQNNSWQKSWPEFYRDNRLKFLLELIKQERPLPDSDVVLYEKLLQRIPDLLPRNSKSGLIHGDLWSGNYMLSNKGPALIDPASCYADREMEFGIITMFGGFSQRFYSAYNEIYPLLDDWRERNHLYQLYHVLNHYYLFGGGYRNQALRIAKMYL